MNTPLKPLGLGEIPPYVSQKNREAAEGMSEDDMARVLAEDEEANSHDDLGDDSADCASCPHGGDPEDCETCSESLILRIQNAMLTDDADQSARLATLYADASDAGKELLNDAFVCLCGYTIPSLLEMGPNADTHVVTDTRATLCTECGRIKGDGDEAKDGPFCQCEEVHVTEPPDSPYRATALDSFWQVIDRNQHVARLAACAIAWHGGSVADAHRFVADGHAFGPEEGRAVAGFLEAMYYTPGFDHRRFKAEWERRYA